MQTYLGDQAQAAEAASHQSAWDTLGANAAFPTISIDQGATQQVLRHAPGPGSPRARQPSSDHATDRGVLREGRRLESEHQLVFFQGGVEFPQ
ncbi:hypothetical protein D9M68_210860 [compost metagenome]